MKLLIYFSVILSCFSAFAKTTELRMFSENKKTYEIIKITDFQDVKISENCIKAGKANCQAWNAVLNKIPRASGSGAPIGNPASHYCADQKANNRILLDQQKREYDYCVFSDGSLIDSWSLYYKHFGGK